MDRHVGIGQPCLPAAFDFLAHGNLILDGVLDEIRLAFLAAFSLSSLYFRAIRCGVTFPLIPFTNMLRISACSAVISSPLTTTLREASLSRRSPRRLLSKLRGFFRPPELLNPR